jgi:hypothetical protein
MTTRIDPAAVKDLADRVALDRVWKPHGRTMSGVERVEARVVPMGRDGKPRAFLIEFRKSLKKRRRWSEMVERVAKAIRNNGSVRYDPDWEGVSEEAKEMFRQDARAAIAAMREPTEEVLMLVFETGSGGRLCAWQMMIDKILEER